MEERRADGQNVLRTAAEATIEPHNFFLLGLICLIIVETSPRLLEEKENVGT